MCAHSEDLQLRWLAGRFAVCRLAADAPAPQWTADPAELLCVTRTADELSIIAPQDRVPAGVTAERDFVALRVVGILEFSTVGVLAKLTGALADAGVSAVALSTFDTDYLLVRVAQRSAAHDALERVATIQHETCEE